MCRRTAAPYCVPTACVCQHNSYCALTNTRGVRIGGADFPDDVLGFLLEKLADVEYRLAHATNEQLQLSAGGRVPVRAREARGCRSLTERSCAETHCVHDIV